LLQVGVAPELSVAVKVSVVVAAVVLEPLVGAVIVTTGGVGSVRVTVTDVVVLLVDGSVQVTEIVLLPTASGWLLPLVLLQVGVAPELSVAVKVRVALAAVVLEPSVGAEIVTTGATLSVRVTVAEAVALLVEGSVQVTEIVLLPKASA
jgi:hypothetical protein